ncbi:MAG: (Fe-S)-binding protein, partial [Candidatus Neomarinimicrobiota bacterium]
YARTMGDREVRPLVNGLITSRELWSCTTCRACMQVCPVLIDHIPAIVDLRRHLVLSEGQPPDEAAPVLEKMTQQGNPWGFPRGQRLKWAEDAGLHVPLMADKGQADVLYWVGCAGAYDPRNQEVSRAMVAILQAADIDFAVLGQEESCTGDSARRMGEEYVYETLALGNMETLKQYKFNRIVTACPHCFQILGADYSQFGADWQVVHHSDFINQLLQAGRLTVAGNGSAAITYHDACYLGRHHGKYDVPRDVIAAATGTGTRPVEPSLAREQSFCCGAGGGNMWYELEADQRINLARFDQLSDTGAGIIATACAFCLIMLDDACKVRGREADIQVKDIAELIAEGIS